MKESSLDQGQINQFLISILGMVRSSTNYDVFVDTLVGKIASFLGFEVGHYYAHVLNNERLESSGIFYTKTNKKFASLCGFKKTNLYLVLIFIFSGIYYQTKVRQVKYSYNIVETDHRFIKKDH